MSSKFRYVWALFILAAALIAYYPALHGEFVWDDLAWTVRLEPLLKNVSGLWRIWTSATAMQQYYPLIGTSFWLDYHIWGFWTLPYHVENVVLHVMGALLLWRLLNHLEVKGAWLAAAIFALHPIMVESAGWITERKNVLSLPLFLGALLAYGRFASFWKTDLAAQPRDWRWYGLAVLLFLAAMFAKITAFSFPAVVLVLAWWKQGRLRWRRDFMPVLPLLIPAGVLCFLISWLEKHHLGGFGPDFDLPMSTRLMVAGRVPWYYALKLLWPVNLCFYYPGWKLDAHSVWQWLLVALTLMTPIAAWLARGRIGRGLAAGIFIYLGVMFPVLGFTNVCGMRFTFVADRWNYCSSVALIALAGSAVAALGSRLRSPWLPRVAGVLVLPALAIQTWSHAAVLKDSESLWGSILEMNPRCWNAWAAVGMLRMNQNRTDEALRAYHKALELDPNDFEARTCLGIAYLKLNRVDDAISEFQYMLAAGPSAGGDLSRAILHHNLAHAMLRKGKVREAISQYEEGLSCDPENPKIQLDLCLLFLQLGRAEDAFPHYRKAVELSPADPEVQTRMEMDFLKQRHYRAAALSCEMAVRLKPEDWGSLADLAWMLAAGDASVRNGPKALAAASKADRLSGGNNPAVLHTLAAALAETGRFKEAVETANRALHLTQDGNDAEIAESIRKAKAGYERHLAYHDPALSHNSLTASGRP